MMFEHGVERVNDEFNLFRIVQSINKLKAAVNVLLNEVNEVRQKEIVEQIELNFVIDSILKPEGFMAPTLANSEMYQFMHIDEKRKLYQSQQLFGDGGKDMIGKQFKENSESEIESYRINRTITLKRSSKRLPQMPNFDIQIEFQDQ